MESSSSTMATSTFASTSTLALPPITSTTSTSTLTSMSLLPEPTFAPPEPMSHLLYSSPGCRSRLTLVTNMSSSVCYPGAFWCESIAGLSARQCTDSAYTSKSVRFGCSPTKYTSAGSYRTSSLTWYSCANCSCSREPNASQTTNYVAGDCYTFGSGSEMFKCDQIAPAVSASRAARQPSHWLSVSLALVTSIAVFLL
ncbi:hypothetical protein BC831DRAFT_444735 [Entophlyctis helioformis]|nr:hypothetical protein BC831DRAFT_444735 [Entophlyctis helioformis]